VPLQHDDGLADLALSQMIENGMMIGIGARHPTGAPARERYGG
jgi:hypothetical protein